MTDWPMMAEPRAVAPVLAGSPEGGRKLASFLERVQADWVRPPARSSRCRFASRRDGTSLGSFCRSPWDRNWVRLAGPAGRSLASISRASRPGNDRSPFVLESRAELAPFRNPGQGPGSGTLGGPGSEKVSGRQPSCERVGNEPAVLPLAMFVRYPMSKSCGSDERHERAGGLIAPPLRSGMKRCNDRDAVGRPWPRP
jgi:hypothetical protein